MTAFSVWLHARVTRRRILRFVLNMPSNRYTGRTPPTARVSFDPCSCCCRVKGHLFPVEYTLVSVSRHISLVILYWSTLHETVNNMKMAFLLIFLSFYFQIWLVTQPHENWPCRHSAIGLPCTSISQRDRSRIALGKRTACFNKNRRHGK